MYACICVCVCVCICKYVYIYIYIYIYVESVEQSVDSSHVREIVPEKKQNHKMSALEYEQALVSLKFKKPVDAGVGRTFAVTIEGG